jgi:hypothetical protein
MNYLNAYALRTLEVNLTFEAPFSADAHVQSRRTSPGSPQAAPRLSMLLLNTATASRAQHERKCE